ncbi:MAG: hypothetical protein KC583_20040, partial [Myxococcales bacterium]|nr:hypothetical protein [Myxococcales bacterium]
RFVSRAPAFARRLALLLVALLATACKVPLEDIDAGFVLADAAWFEAEETLFVFYELTAEQGLSADSVVEIRYVTDDVQVDWTPLHALPQVHTHVPTECVFERRCGSASLHVPAEPRAVRLRLRYHRDGELALDAATRLNIVEAGPAHTNRSLLVYGVFDEANRAIQWRARHQFPAVRNEQAQRLGLRRHFSVDDRRYGAGLTARGNPYLYGVACPGDHTAYGADPVDTEARAVFDPDDLPEAGAEAATVCAQATVRDATGDFTATAVARKNPEVSPAFPVLRSPIRDALQVKFLLAPCARTISARHLAMQRQRLGLGGVDPICIDDWQPAALQRTLEARFREGIEAARPEGRDMVLVIGLHHDTPAITDPVEAALRATLDGEASRRTPRVAGAFLLDSYAHVIEDEDLPDTTLWCPSMIVTTGDLGDLADQVTGAGCAVLPDNLALSLGPFTIGGLPILPSRDLYLDFIDRWSEAQAGEVTDLTFRVPELPPSADHVDIQPFGVATFFNGEVITAQPEDAFSFCETDEYEGFVFRPPVQVPAPGLLPIAALPAYHAGAPQPTYGLGIVWDFPYLMRLEYEAVAAISVSAFSASVPFGVPIDAEQDFGSELWLRDTFSLEDSLAHCRRFCDQPTFDSAGVYQVAADFRGSYMSTCYRPDFPERG